MNNDKYGDISAEMRVALAAILAQATIRGEAQLIRRIFSASPAVN